VARRSALRSFGWYAMLGELATLTTAILFLPAMLKLLPSERWHAPAGEALEEHETVRQAEEAMAAAQVSPPRHGCARGGA